MPPVLKQLKVKTGDRATILKNDIYKNPAYVQNYVLQAVPTLIILNRGKIAWQCSGVMLAKAIISLRQQLK
ncbi:hypothetical protein BH11BAC4_BH11BAC4_14270 [soil metagenome]